MILDNTCVSSFLNLLVEGDLLQGEKISGIFTKILLILVDQLFKLLKRQALADSIVNLVTNLGNFGAHAVKKPSALLKKKVFDVSVIDLSDVAKSILVAFVEGVKFCFYFTGH